MTSLDIICGCDFADFSCRLWLIGVWPLNLLPKAILKTFCDFVPRLDVDFLLVEGVVDIVFSLLLLHSFGLYNCIFVFVSSGKSIEMRDSSDDKPISGFGILFNVNTLLSLQLAHIEIASIVLNVWFFHNSFIRNATSMTKFVHWSLFIHLIGIRALSGWIFNSLCAVEKSRFRLFFPRSVITNSILISWLFFTYNWNTIHLWIKETKIKYIRKFN